MKLFVSLSLLLILQPTFLTAAADGDEFPLTNEVDEGAGDDIPEECLGGGGEGEEDVCLVEEEVCTTDPDACCEGLSCVGYAFFKKCAEPPTCLEQWYDCSEGPACCGDYACVVRDNGAKECDTEEIDTRTVNLEEIDQLVDSLTESPTFAPVPKNTETTFVDGEPVQYDIACSSGDPHIRTFDGITYDCQGEGEFILAKSYVTAREVQARYEHMGTNKAISVGTGVAVQDEGETTRIQISVASSPATVGNDMGDKCTLLFYVDGVKKDLFLGYEDEHVTVTDEGNRKYVINYKKTGFKVTASYFKCRFNICATVPMNDLTYGVLGTANNNATDEWMLEDRSTMVIPKDRSDKLRKPGYDFCSGHMCLRDEKLSLFVHEEDGYDFEAYKMCDLPYGDTFEEFMENIPQWVVDICGTEMSCIMDVRNGDEEDAKMLRLARLEYGQICNPTGGECEDSDCCGEIPCADFGGSAGKTCGGDMTCAPDLGSCETLECCDGFTCVELNDGSKQCREDLTCQLDWMSCGTDDKQCCDGLQCLYIAAKDMHQCRHLPSCMKEWDDCSLVGCCGDAKCVEVGGGAKQCLTIPKCWKRQWRDCSLAPCCEGLTCIKHDGRDVCRKLPECERVGRSCEYVPCCEDHKGRGPTECATVSDPEGNPFKQCRLVPGDVEIVVFSDLDDDGIRNPGVEPGIEGVKLGIFEETGNHETLVRTPMADPEVSDVDGKVVFKNILKGKRIRVQVLEGPPGGVHTKKTRGDNKYLDSNLRHDGWSDQFRQVGEVFKNVSLGYKLPRDVEVFVFEDANYDGIQDEGEPGIPGVHMRLIHHKIVDGVVQDVVDTGIGGSAHEDLISDANGKVVFRHVPQNMWLRVQVLKPPEGGIPTKKNQGGDDTNDSDLNHNGISDSFRVGAGLGTFDHMDIGYRLPEGVLVRVWDDVDRDGVQDHGEPGLAGVKLRLTYHNKTALPGFDIKESDADGIVSFVNVPLNTHIRIEVVEKPLGAVATLKNKGGDEENDSDLNNDMFSDHFRITGGGAYTARDMGFSMPGSMMVRVWDDENHDGVQDEGEVGVKGAVLQVKKRHPNWPEPKEYVDILENGGNAHLPQETNDEGYVVFTQVPQKERILVYVLNKPPGAYPTGSNKGGDEALDSDLRHDGRSHEFWMNEGNMTKLDLGYRMPTDLEVRVWDDANQNGIQDEGEGGVPDVQVRLVFHNKSDLVCDTGGTAGDILKTNESGIVRFTEVPKDEAIRVKIVNKPPGATRTNANQGGKESDEKDSDLGHDSTTHTFRLRDFAGGVYGSVDVGYLLPEDLQIRVWDDVNYNGIQDKGELGIADVGIELVKHNQDPITDIAPGGNCNETLYTNEDGIVTFKKVPKYERVRARVADKPYGAIPTRKSKGNETIDSDLNNNWLSDHFYMKSFDREGPMGTLDLGFRMPPNMDVFVWDDVNGNGKQDDEEPGIDGVELVMLQNNKQPFENVGEGSNIHTKVFTENGGIATFTKVPRGTRVRVKVTNAPRGSVATRKNFGGNKNGTDFSDSDLNNDLVSDSFHTNSFEGPGAIGRVDLGFRMPKTVVIRVWNDTNADGIQDDTEPGITGVNITLINDKTKEVHENLPPLSNANQTLATDSTGRVYFTYVPQGVKFRFFIAEQPEGMRATAKNKGDNEQFDSEMNNNGWSDWFRLPSDVESIYDLTDAGYKLR